MSSISTRVASLVSAVALTVAVATTLSPRARALPAPQSETRQRGLSVGDDTAMVHRELRKAIERFQDEWRKTWKKIELKRHDYINLANIRGYAPRADGIVPTGGYNSVDAVWEGDRDAMNLTPDLRRYLAILCNIDSPSDAQIEHYKARKNTDIGTHFNVRATPIGSNTSGTIEKVRLGGFQKEVDFVGPRLIQSVPNYGAICPSWVPPDERLPLDEGESIDLALPPNSREPLRRLREQLITVLATAQAKYPKDEWIAGQRLRFVIDQRSPTRGIDAAKLCGGSAIVCAQYMGLAQEHANHIPAAEAAYRFADSLILHAQAPATKNCIHPETLMLLAHDDRDEAQKGTCEQQRAYVDRMWWLADPLWSVPGNERYVAHESRRVHATLRAVLDRDERYVWAKLGGGDTMRELVVRYGWPGYTYWPGGQLEEEINKVRENGATARFVMPPYTAKEYSYDRTALIPSGIALLDPFKATTANFQLNLPEGKDQDQWWPQEHMMLWTKVKPLAPGQQAQWRRDTTILFSMAVDNAISGLDTAATGASHAALMASTSRNDIRTLFETPINLGQTLRLHGEYSSSPFVLSAEVQARTIREPARRLRFGLHPPPTLREMKPNEVAISDPVFMDMPSKETVLPNNLTAATVFMTGGLEFSRTEALALFWESYGFAPDDTVNFQLRVNRKDSVNPARRLGAALGVVSGLRDSVSIKWTEPSARSGASIITGAKPVIGRSVAVDTRSLPEGDYVVSIEMRSNKGAVAKAERTFALKESR